MQSYKRKRYLIKKAFQLRYTGVILFFILLTALASTASIYFISFPYLSEKLANVYPQGRLLTVLRDANLKVLLSVALMLPVAVWFGVLLSHRIAGPWYRMESILTEIAEGGLASEVKLRKGDELQSLASAINEVTRSIRAMSLEDLAYLKSLDDTLKEFEAELNQQPFDPMKAKLLISKLQGISGELKNLMRKYKINPDSTIPSPNL
jgi:methyl-accepting chemotaxis protein